LAVDLLTGDRIHDLKGPEVVPVETPGAVMISDTVPEARGLVGGALLIPEGWLWSWLDPLQASPVLEEVTTDRIEVESFLRAAARRFRARLTWYRNLDPLLRESCRNLLRGFPPDRAPLFDILDEAVVAPAGLVAEEEEIEILPGLEPIA
jgi:hypothetical protein